MYLKNSHPQHLTISLAISILSFIGMVLVLIYTSRYGVGISPDSTIYISVARNLISGNGYLTWSGRSLISYPPLFSTILAILGLTGIDPLNGARFFNAIIFGLIIFTSGQLFRTCIRSKMLVILGVVSILLSIPLLGVSVMAWTEPLFILLVVLFIICLQKFLREKRWSILFLLSIIAAFACVQRYIGITLVFTGFVLIIFALPKVSFLQRLKYGIVFCIISIAPFFIWMGRNYILTQTFMGPRSPSSYSLSQNIHYTFNVLTTWFVSPSIPFLIRVTGVGLFILIIMTTVLFLRSKRNRRDNNRLIQILPAGIFILIYCIFLINSATKVKFDRINYRLLSPIYAFFMFLILVSVEDISNLLSHSQRSKKVVNSIVIVLFVLLLVYPFVRIIEGTLKRMHLGAGGYNTVRWRESPFIEWLQMNPLDGVIYSNAPDALCILTEKRAKLIPRKYQYSSPNTKGDDLQQVRESLKLNNRTYLVWFSKKHRRYLYSIQDLQSVFILKEVVRLPDGAVYFLKSKE